MALEVRFHPAARAQLFELHDHIATEAGLARAGGYLDRLEASCMTLGQFPEIGRRADALGPGLRLHPFERRAMIVYRIVPEAVEILGIYHGGRDLEALRVRNAETWGEGELPEA